MKLVELSECRWLKRDTTPNDEPEEADMENVQAPGDVGGFSSEAAPFWFFGFEDKMM